MWALGQLWRVDAGQPDPLSAKGAAGIPVVTGGNRDAG